MPTNQSIFVISDLHMGDGGARDNFAATPKGQKPRKEQILSFLEYVKGRNGHLYILGDLFEFWQSSVGRVIVERLDLLDAFAEMNAVYVVGNHDADLQALIGTNLINHKFFENMKEAFIEPIGGKNFKFMHGHEEDPFNSGDTPPLGRALSIAAGIVEDKVGSPFLESGESVETLLLQAVEGIKRMGKWLLKWLVSHIPLIGKKYKILLQIQGGVTPAQDSSLAKQILVDYYKNKQKEGYDIAIVGHTHEPGRCQEWYFNSGSWATDVNSFIEITPEGKVQVYDWTDGTPVQNNTEISPPAELATKSQLPIKIGMV